MLRASKTCSLLTFCPLKTPCNRSRISVEFFPINRPFFRNSLQLVCLSQAIWCISAQIVTFFTRIAQGGKFSEIPVSFLYFWPHIQTVPFRNGKKPLVVRHQPNPLLILALPLYLKSNRSRLVLVQNFPSFLHIFVEYPRLARSFFLKILSLFLQYSASKLLVYSRVSIKWVNKNSISLLIFCAIMSQNLICRKETACNIFIFWPKRVLNYRKSTNFCTIRMQNTTAVRWL